MKIPGIVIFGNPAIDDLDRPNLSVCAKLGARSRSSLQPDKERDVRIRLVDTGTMQAIQLIKHSALPPFPIPVDFLVA